MKLLIAKVRTSKNKTLRELEQLTGISKSTLNDFENEKLMPHIDQLETIAKALDVKIIDLFESEYKL